MTGERKPGDEASRAGPSAVAIRRAAAVVLLALVGVALIENPGLTLLVASGLLLTAALFIAPKVALGGVAVFLIVQPVLVNLAGGPDTFTGLTVRRLHEIVVIAAICRVVLFLGWGGLPVRLTGWVWFVLAFVLAGFASSLTSQVPVPVAVLGAILALKFPVFFLLALTVDWTEQDAVRLVRVGVILPVILLAIGAILLMLPPEAMQLILDPSAEREGFFVRGELRSMQGPFLHPGVFGWAMAVGGCFAIAQLMRRTTPGAVSGLASSVVGMLASLRRKPLLALPIAVVTGLFATGAKRRRLGLVALLLTLALGTGIFGRQRIRTIIEDTVRSYVDPYRPTAARTLLYLTGWQIAREHFPLGAGFGRFGGYVSELYYSPLYDQYGLSTVYGLSRDFPNYMSDTYWPHIVGEAGVLGALVLVSFMLRIWSKCVRAARQSVTEPVRVLAIAAALILIEALVESSVAPIFDSALQAYTIAMPLGITLVLGSRVGRATALAPLAALTPSE